MIIDPASLEMYCNYRALSVLCSKVAKIAKLASHVWFRVFSLCAFPPFRVGSLCEQHRGLEMIRYCCLRTETIEACSFSLDPLHNCFGFIDSDDVEFFLLPEAFELTLSDAPARLATLEDLRSQVGKLNVIQYSAALGAVDCLSVLIRRMGIDSIVKKDGTLNRTMLLCCDARFPFGNRQDFLHTLLLHLEFQHSDFVWLLESACLFGSPWLTRFAVSHVGGELQIPLRIASENGHEECLRLLLDNGAKMEQALLWRASKHGHTGCLALLLDRGASAKGDVCALIFASEKGHTDCVRLLLERGAFVDGKLTDDSVIIASMPACGLSALVAACAGGHAGCARLLLEKGANVNAHDDEGSSALMCASGKGHTDCVRLLLEKGANVNARDIEGSSALMYAFEAGHIDSARLLMVYGAR